MDFVLALETMTDDSKTGHIDIVMVINEGRSLGTL
jgi:hypothetical protein